VPRSWSFRVIYTAYILSEKKAALRSRRLFFAIRAVYQRR